MYVSPDVLSHLDELVRADLQNLRDSYFQGLLIATGAVLIGILMEGPEVVRDLWEGFRKQRHSGSPIKDSYHPLWVLVLSSIGWLLISGGVIGEGIFEALVSKADGSLQTFNDILLASATERASNADTMARAFESQISGAKATAESAKVEFEKLRGNNLVLEAEVLKLREKMAHRHLNSDQRINIVKRLRQFGGETVNIFSLPGEEEMGVAQDIRDALTGKDGAEWRLAWWSGNLMGDAFSGIAIQFDWSNNPNEFERAAAEELACALVSERIDARLKIDRPRSTGKSTQYLPTMGRITVLVGHKP